MAIWNCASSPVWQAPTPNSGRRHAIGLYDIIPRIVTAHPDPLFDMVDRHAQQHQPINTAQVALEQKPGFIAQQPPGFIHSSTYLDHIVSLSHP